MIISSEKNGEDKKIITKILEWKKNKFDSYCSLVDDSDVRFFSVTVGRFGALTLLR